MPKKNSPIEINTPERAPQPGDPFLVRLLFREQVPMPDSSEILAVLEDFMVDAELETAADGMIQIAPDGFSPSGDAQPSLGILPCSPFDGSSIGDSLREQMHACEGEEDRILSECGYQIIGRDFHASGLSPQERANLDMDFVECLAALFPTCEAFLFEPSFSMFPGDVIRDQQRCDTDRFICYAVNYRVFPAEGEDGWIVDTLGMGLLSLRDLQYRFHSMYPEHVLYHAANITSYMLEFDDPLKNGTVLQGMDRGRISERTSWKCRRMNSVTKPARPVVDIHTGPYFNGSR